jgi:sulfate permease, SulP family
VLIAVVVTTSCPRRLDSSTWGEIIGYIPAELPQLQLPHLDSQMVLDLAGPIMAIALSEFIEAISIAKAIAARTCQRLDPNQELVGQGLSNMTAGLLQVYAVSGSISRLAVNSSCGAITGFLSVMTWLIVTAPLL